MRFVQVLNDELAAQCVFLVQVKQKLFHGSITVRVDNCIYTALKQQFKTELTIQREFPSTRSP